MSELDRQFPPKRELIVGVLRVDDVDRLQIADGTAGNRGVVQRQRFLAGLPPELAERRGNSGHLVIDNGDIDNLRLTYAGGVLGYGVQHRLHVTRGIGNYAENVADRRLLLQRLLGLVEQPRVLDRDHCLVGEVLHKLNLSLGEWPHLLAVDDNRPNQRVLLEHWYAKKGSRSCLLDGNDTQGLTFSVCRFGFEIRDMYNLLCPHKPTQSRVRIWRYWTMLLPELAIRGGNIVQMRCAKTLTIVEQDVAKLGATKAQGVHQHGLKYRLHVSRRRADYF